jgi:tRNA dimethylallyltransferase
LRYVIRALEVKILTWKSKRDFREEKTLKYDVLFLTPYIGNRELLYNRINKRVKMMFDEGLIEEVKTLLETYKKSDFWMKTIGYKEVVEYLNWFLTEEECIAMVQKHNRNYAKKQLTWFRKYNNYIEQ